jgi:hypothetical protein
MVEHSAKLAEVSTIMGLFGPEDASRARAGATSISFAYLYLIRTG